MSGEAIKGHLDLLLLAVLQSGPAHGYAVIDRLRRTSRDTFVLPEGTVYPALHRLERTGLIASKWDKATGRRRRVYRLTSSGRRSLAKRRREWQTFSSGIAGVLEGQ